MRRIVALILTLVMVFALCACGKSDDVKTVETMIEDIGDVSLDSGAVIVQAETAYNDLSKKDKNAVENYAVLQEARASYDELVEPAQYFASELLTAGAHLFANPLSVQVKNVWYYGMSEELHYFTFELEVKNTAGVMETVYYGNEISIVGLLDDDTLDQIKTSIHLAQAFGMLGDSTDNDYFTENQINAMQNGVELDADAIQDYFIKNY